MSQISPLDLSGETSVHSQLNKTRLLPNSSKRDALELYQIQLELSKLLCDDGLCRSLNPLIDYVYNPLEYAKDNHIQFLQTYASSPKKLMFLGMNPGPWGMMQTGIPFGEVHIVRDWLKLDGVINSPARQHPNRLVKGFFCTRSEVSGKRFWTLAKHLSRNDPSLFFKNTFVYNYYPLALLSTSGKNITPSDLKANEQKKIFGACDATLCRIVDFLQVKVVVAIGRFAEKRAREALKTSFPHVKHMAEHMAAALSLAKAALQNGEVPVGCLFIHKGEIIARGSNTVNETRNATRHAEMDCIETVTAHFQNWKQVLLETVVVVTVEPCIMCASALHTVRVAAIIYGCANDRFGGCSSVLDTSSLFCNPSRVEGGVCAAEAMELLKKFYKGSNPNAPEDKVKKKRKLDLGV